MSIWSKSPPDGMVEIVWRIDISGTVFNCTDGVTRGDRMVVDIPTARRLCSNGHAQVFVPGEDTGPGYVATPFPDTVPEPIPAEPGNDVLLTATFRSALGYGPRRCSSQQDAITGA